LTRSWRELFVALIAVPTAADGTLRESQISSSAPPSHPATVYEAKERRISDPTTQSQKICSNERECLATQTCPLTGPPIGMYFGIFIDPLVYRLAPLYGAKISIRGTALTRIAYSLLANKWRFVCGQIRAPTKDAPRSNNPTQRWDADVGPNRVVALQKS
jgi:hypothetical protein